MKPVRWIITMVVIGIAMASGAADPCVPCLQPEGRRRIALQQHLVRADDSAAGAMTHGLVREGI
jgi:hypothetical protein